MGIAIDHGAGEYSQRVTLRPAETLRRTVTATIANGASLSGAVDLGGYRVAALDMPAGWTAAALTFQASNTDGSYGDLYDEAGAEVTVPSAAVAASRRIVPGSTLALHLLAHRYLKVRSGTAAAAVAQAAERAITLVLVPA